MRQFHQWVHIFWWSIMWDETIPSTGSHFLMVNNVTEMRQFLLTIRKCEPVDGIVSSHIIDHQKMWTHWWNCLISHYWPSENVNPTGSHFLMVNNVTEMRQFHQWVHIFWWSIMWDEKIPPTGSHFLSSEIYNNVGN
jgi:hypothetical protein